jgi:predicted nucleotidyltransferase
MKTLAPDLLEEIVHRLVEDLRPEQIILFGSHAWGTPTDDSDIDLLLVMPENGLSRAEIDLRARASLRDLGISKDILIRTRAQLERYGGVAASLERKILDRGVRLYG